MILGTQQGKSERVEALADRLASRRRILFFGEMGIGKSTLAITLLQILAERKCFCQLFELDPGSPPFGVPGTVSRAGWNNTGLICHDYQALCSLDAARFRLPLIQAARRLLTGLEREGGQKDMLLIDPPGVARGVGGAELLTALAELFKVDIVVALHREEKSIPLTQELAALKAEVIFQQASSAARAARNPELFGKRTKLWDDFLAGSTEETIALDDVFLLGTPPPGQIPEAWTGRQAALLDNGGGTIGMGEAVRLEDGQLSLRMVFRNRSEPAGLLVRDAGRNSRGSLQTIRPARDKGRAANSSRKPAELTSHARTSMAGYKPVSSNLGPAWATLAGGPVGDPLVHVRLRNRKQSLLFDLGDAGRLAARVAHQVNHVFLSHAHIDHIGGLTWLLRSRLGPFGPCKIFGPEETITRIENFIGSITWDRIGDSGPVFDVFEIRGRTLCQARLRPGRNRGGSNSIPIEDEVILKEKNFMVKAAVCDHNIPSVAYALLFLPEIKVRKDRLKETGLPPGPWLGTLKKCLHDDTPEAEIELPDGQYVKAGKLAEDLIFIRPGKKMVYAADMADTPDNRRKVINLARAAHTFFCETAFLTANRKKAMDTQHLTTSAAAEIARNAGVKQLIPFHFSKRYAHNLDSVYEEIRQAAGPVRVLGHQGR
jgi:ribonuclease Z